MFKTDIKYEVCCYVKYFILYRYNDYWMKVEEMGKSIFTLCVEKTKSVGI